MVCYQKQGQQQLRTERVIERAAMRWNLMHLGSMVGGNGAGVRWSKAVSSRAARSGLGAGTGRARAQWRALTQGLARTDGLARAREQAYVSTNIACLV
jgi:hypothetical protein